MSVTNYPVISGVGSAGGGSGILVFPNFAAFPVTGDPNTFYYDDGADDMYFWNGAAYESTGGGSPVDTDAVPEGVTNLYYTDGRVDVRIGLANLGDLANVRSTAAATDQILAWSGSQWQPANLEDIAMKQYTLLLDEVSATVSYVGEAVPGALQADPVWRIKKLDESGAPELVITWADGTSDFDKVWDDRATYTYS